MQKLSSSFLVPFEDRISSFYNKHKEHIYLFLFLLAVNMFVYGQRLVGFILAPDDVARMMIGSGEQASWNARWFNGFIGSTILGGERHILLFFNAALGVFSITLAGFITAFLFEAKRKSHIAIITLLCSTVPAWAFQLYFSTNTIVFVSTAWGVYGIYALYRYKAVGKIIGFILLVCAVGTYQSIVLVATAIVFIKTTMRCLCAERGKEMLRAALHMLAMIVAIALSYIASSAVNSAVVYFSGAQLHMLGYMETEVSLTATGILAAVVAVVSNVTTVYSLLYEKAYLLLLSVLGVLAAVSGIRAIKNYHTKLWAWKLIALLFFFVAMLLVKELLRVLGVSPPSRVQYVMGWIAAGLFLIAVLRGNNTAVSRLARNLVFLTAAGIVIINTFVINVFFSLAQRETQVNIIRVNQIVASIRANKNYPGEETPLRLRVLGDPERLEKRYYLESLFSSFSVFSSFAVNGLLINYTDLNFVPMSDDEFVSLQPRMRARADEIKAHPNPEFVFIDGRNVVLFLDAEDVLKNRLKDVYKTKDRYPVIARSGGFDIFVSQDTVCYFNPASTAEVKSDMTFLHVVPEDVADLPSKETQKRGFIGLTDFSFADAENRQADTNGEDVLFTCKPLPNYPIAMIRTGQYKPVGGMQKVKFLLGEINRRRKESKSIKEFVASLKQLAMEVKNSTLQYPWQNWSVTISGEELRRAQEVQQVR